METKKLTTLNIVDLDSGDDAVVIIRTIENYVSICISKESDGDVEVLLGIEECESIISELNQAVKVAKQ